MRACRTASVFTVLSLPALLALPYGQRPSQGVAGSAQPPIEPDERTPSRAERDVASTSTTTDETLSIDLDRPGEHAWATPTPPGLVKEGDAPTPVARRERTLAPPRNLSLLRWPTARGSISMPPLTFGR